MYLLDYLNRIMLHFGYFETIEAAEQWIDNNDSARRDHYTIIHVGPGIDGDFSRSSITRYVNAK